MLSKEHINQSAAERIAPLKLAGVGPDTLLVSEVYRSLQGESSYAGVPCVFVRTTGCHLRCRYCDTAHAFSQGTVFSSAELLEKIRGFNTQLIEFTGGEPLLQLAVASLMKRLCDEGYTVLIETSGAVSIAHLDQRVKAIIDVKTPGSGEANRNCWANLKLLWPGCEVKFVICNREDYEFAKDVCEQYQLYSKTTVLFSPEAEQMDKTQLAEWILEDSLSVRFQVQLHKILWGNKHGV